MPLVVSLRHQTTIPVEVDSIRLEAVRTLSADGVKAILIQYGNKQVPLGEFFDGSGSAAEDEEIVWQGDCSHVKWIGARLSGGRVRVEGNAGMHLGAEMTGGEIVVEGNAADWAGAEMRGGRIRIRGNAGDMAGAVYRGGRRGMTGGEMLIDGNAGDEVGSTMRRGLIAVGGNAGNTLGFGMLAGTVLVFGEAGVRPGAGMKRGTIGLLGRGPHPDLLPTFRRACRYRPVFLRMYLRHLRWLGFSCPEDCFDATYDRYCGDFLEDGRGEILIRAEAR